MKKSYDLDFIFKRLLLNPLLDLDKAKRKEYCERIRELRKENKK